MVIAMSTRDSGFTLIEMLITLVVISVLLTIGVGAYRPAIVNQGVKTAANDLYSALQYARSEAIKHNDTITLRAGATTDGAWTTGWRLVDSANTVLRSWTAASSVAISVTPSGATTLTFSRDGRLTGGSAPKLQVDPAVSLSGVFQRCVTVDLSGRPRTTVGACT